MTDRRLKLKAAVERAIQDAAPKLNDISQFLWTNPELGRHEEKAHAALTDLLEQLGFQVQRRAGAPTAFIASHSSSSSSSSGREGGKARPHVAFMCEYDALPEVGHACGHNLIAECAVGAGLAARAAMLEAGIEGRVTVLGTPAEETDGGKIDFIEAGFFADVDAAMMVHPVGGGINAVAPQFNASDQFYVVYEGRASHAASNPWEAVNALDAAVQAYQSVAHLRQHIRPDCRVAGVITRGGEVPNVIPERTELEFTLRAPDTSKMAELQRGWRACVEAAATATGCSLTVTRISRPYDELASNRRLCEVYKAKAEAVGVATVAESFVGASTDMGNVSHVVPAIHPMFHIGSEVNIHERDFAADAGGQAAQKFALQQAAVLAMTALDVLTDAELRREIRAEFEQRRGSL